MGDMALSLIRTYVPIGVGAVIGWLIATGVLDADTSATVEASLVVAVTGVAQGVYYTIARILSSKWPLFGVLLGATKNPTY